MANKQINELSSKTPVSTDEMLVQESGGGTNRKVVAGDLLDRDNHTGSQTASTISDFDTEVGNHSDVVANTAARHAESHTVASHSDTTATGAELDTLTDGSNADALHAHAGSGAPEGTAVLSTGEAGGTKYLREDGDGTSSWQTIAAGGGNMNTSAYDPAAIEEQLVGLVAAQTLTNKTIDADSNTITNVGIPEFDTDMTDLHAFFHGAALDSPVVTVASDGTAITLSLEANGGGDVRIMFSDGVHTHDCTPADTVALTAGTDSVPAENYVYILQSNLTLTRSTSGWPSEEHAPVATVVCQSAATMQTELAMKVHAWTDHTEGGDEQGHLTHLNKWIRHQHATWMTGGALTPTAGASTLDIAVSSAVVMQLHHHTFPARDTESGDAVYLVNHPDTAYLKALDLTQTYVDKASDGTVLGANATDHYNLVIWGVVSEVEADCKLMCNLPSAAYNSNAGDKAVDDLESTANYNIPSEYKGCGFLIARLTVQESGGTYTVLQNAPLLGLQPGHEATGGGASSAGNEFQDSLFQIQDTDDITRVIDFDAGSITSGQTRTITMADADVDLGNLAPTNADNTAANETSHTNVAKTDVDQTWTGSQRITPHVENGGSFDMDARNDFLCIPASAIALTFTNITEGQRGMILLLNSPGRTITAAASIEHDADFLTTLSTSGNYMISYWAYNGTTVVATSSQALT